MLLATLHDAFICRIIWWKPFTSSFCQIFKYLKIPLINLDTRALFIKKFSLVVHMPNLFILYIRILVTTSCTFVCITISIASYYLIISDILVLFSFRDQSAVQRQTIYTTDLYYAVCERHVSLLLCTSPILIIQKSPKTHWPFS